MDRAHYRKRVRDLNECAALIDQLTRMPDRATEKDFRQLADLLREAAKDVEALLNAELPGCTCRRVEHDDSSCLDYNESCRHHAHLVARLASNKKHYEDAEKKLKNEVHVRLVAAALSGTAGTVLVTADLEVEDVVDAALQIADRAIWVLTKEDA